MLRVSLVILMLASFIFGDDTKDKVEIYSTYMNSKDNIVKASGEVTVVYKDYFLSADEAIYDKNTSNLELFGNIRANQANQYKLLGDYAKLNIAKKERVFRPFYMLEKSSEVWISADEGCTFDKDFEISSGVMSGCNPNDPLWKLHFSSSTYNSDDMWLNVYNARIFIHDIPVFYTPYFGYSLDTKRRTGLLVPTFGISENEGFYYQQPIYIAEQNWWDLELRPQVRTSRGYGGYAKFRFIDSAISKGEITTGYFKEQNSYFEKNKLAHETHYGYNILYNNSDVINQWFNTNFKGQSGLYLDINHMNDVDYINLAKSDTTETITSTQVLSRINLFYNNDTDYFGAYFKYYQDLTKVSNDETLQKLPTIQYHRYLDTFFDDHLIYNIDVQSNNIYREAGKYVTQTNINVPITLQASFFDEYLNASYKTSLYAQHSKFNGEEVVKTGDWENGYYARNNHIFSLSTQLSRAYDDFVHVVGFGSSYRTSGGETKTGFYKDYLKPCSGSSSANYSQCEFYNISDVEDELELDFTQYIYGASGNQVLYHRLAQKVNYENTDDRFGELENELEYQLTTNIKLYNNLLYNYNENKFSKLYNELSYNSSSINISLSHLYKDTFEVETLSTSPFTSYLTSSASYTYDKHYSYHLRYNYDIERSLKKSAEIGFLYQKRCWNFGIKYLENNRPILTNSGSESINDRYIYFTIVLKPMMSPDSGPLYEHKLPE